MTVTEFLQWAAQHKDRFSAYSYRYPELGKSRRTPMHEEIIFHPSPDRQIRFVSPKNFREVERLAIARCIAEIVGVECPKCKRWTGRPLRKHEEESP